MDVYQTSKGVYVVFNNCTSLLRRYDSDLKDFIETDYFFKISPAILRDFAESGHFHSQEELVKTLKNLKIKNREGDKNIFVYRYDNEYNHSSVIKRVLKGSELYRKLKTQNKVSRN